MYSDDTVLMPQHSVDIMPLDRRLQEGLFIRYYLIIFIGFLNNSFLNNSLRPCKGDTKISGKGTATAEKRTENQ